MGHCTELHEDEVVYCTVNVELEPVSPLALPAFYSADREPSSRRELDPKREDDQHARPREGPIGTAGKLTYGPIGPNRLPLHR